jgi:hypothetical protein
MHMPVFKSCIVIFIEGIVLRDHTNLIAMFHLRNSEECIPIQLFINNHYMFRPPN